ncbi:MAG: hypothetical protein D6762_07305 [Candidatus Neomarinimicrobiota bacterium]|nr:MAG: hypothetical protein D6762_07305 [Candidatus Neomarinimicrobiota bacterium]
MSHLNRSALIYVAVFGTFWGLLEASLGSVLHALRLPFSGSILSSLGLIVLLVARRVNNVPGSSALMGVIAGAIKVLGFATVKLGPLAGILMEALIVETAMSLLGPGLPGFLIAGVVEGVYPIIQTLVTKSILFGASFVPVILDTARGFSERVGGTLGWWLLALYILIHIAFGLAGASAAWIIQRQLQQDLNSDAHPQ